MPRKWRPSSRKPRARFELGRSNKSQSNENHETDQIKREMVMSTTVMATGRPVVKSDTSVFATGAFWERMWRTSGLQFLGLFIISSLIYGYQPPVGASAESLTAFYSGNSMRILIAAALSGLNLLNLLWFVAALRSTLSDAGQDGWGAAATASSTAFAAMSLLQMTVAAALAYSIAGLGNPALTSGLHSVSWALVVT